MSIYIIGGGSLGLLYAARLAALSNVSINLVTRTSAQAEAINDAGIKLIDSGGRTTSRMMAVPFVGEQIRGMQTADYVFLMVKQTHINATFLRQLSSSMGPGSMLVCFQNGIGHIEQISKFVPFDSVYTAISSEGANKQDDRTVVHTGSGKTAVGLATRMENEQTNGRKDDKRARKLVNLLNDAGLSSFMSKDTNSIVWNKLVVNSVINPLTAMMRIRNGQLLLRPEYLQLMRSLFDEALATATGLGIKVADDLWEQLLDICQRTSANESSMLQDLKAGRKTEIEYINGGIIRMASKCGVNTPVHQAVYLMVKEMEKESEG